jgi:hypothetical protein
MDNLIKEDFIRLASSIKLRGCRTPNTPLALYLAKLHTGETDERLAPIFNIPRSSAELLMGIDRARLKRDFIPLHLGLSRLAREGLRAHSTEIAQMLFAGNNVDKVLTIWDGTYVCI